MPARHNRDGKFVKNSHGTSTPVSPQKWSRDGPGVAQSNRATRVPRRGDVTSGTRAQIYPRRQAVWQRGVVPAQCGNTWRTRDSVVERRQGALDSREGSSATQCCGRQRQQQRPLRRHHDFGAALTRPGPALVGCSVRARFAASQRWLSAVQAGQNGVAEATRVMGRRSGAARRDEGWQCVTSLGRVGCLPLDVVDQVESTPAPTGSPEFYRNRFDSKYCDR